MDYHSAFAGIKVVDLTGGVAGPSCAMMLGQHGADVIKVETPHNGGDWARILGRTYEDHSTFSIYGTLGKRSVAVDLKTPEGNEILWRLINGPLGQAVRQIGLADSSLTHISRAVRSISEHYAKPFRVEDLARSCGMSASAFHRSFHAVTALSPIQFQKQIRLQKSRLLLLTGESDVATAGFRVGYESASQFSREYRRQFGLPPGRDAARLRAV